MSPEPCRGFQSCCSESCCVWFAANPACGVAQSSQQEGEMLSVPKLQLLGMVYLPPARNSPCRKQLRSSGRQWTKEVPAAASKGCCLRNSSCFPGGSLCEGRLFSEIFPVPSQPLLLFWGLHVFVLCMLCLGKYSLFPRVVSSTEPNPSPSPWCPHASTELVWGTGNVISSELQEAVGWETLSDGISKPSQSWKGERSLLKAGQPAAEWSPRIFGSLSCLPPGFF